MKTSENTNLTLDHLSISELRAVRRMRNVFPFLVTKHYSSLINWNNPDDPLRRQVVPVSAETIVKSHESSDPLNENACMPVPFLIKKYKGRVLWLITTHCPTHCRFCFRRSHLQNNDIESAGSSEESIAEITLYIKKHPEIHEVILSGGDPLMIPRSRLNRILKILGNIDHVRLLRIHTRCPITIPDLETEKKSFFTDSRCVLRIVVHINHPAELSPNFFSLVEKYKKCGIPILTQTVLLANVNDKTDVLRNLFMGIVSIGAQPYYLHLLDPAPGTSHFSVSSKIGVRLIQELRYLLPGYAVPQLVREIPGRGSKTVI